MGSRQTIVIVLIAFLIVGLVPYQAFSQMSIDISKEIYGHWAYPQLRDWIQKGLLKGYDDGSIQPDTPISRAQFITLVNRAFGFIREAKIDFVDVPINAWYRQQIAIAIAAGYLDNTQNKHIHPEQLLSRQEAKAILERVLEQENAEPIPNGHEVFSRAEAVVMLSSAAGEIFHKPITYGNKKKQTTILGNVTVNTGDVKLENVVIKGDLYLAESIAEADVVLEDVIVQGKTYVAGGGINSVHITGASTLNKVIVDKKTGKIRIVLSDNVSIDQLTLRSDALIEKNGDSNIQNLLIRDNEGISVELKGDFENIQIDSLHALLHFLDGLISRLTITTPVVVLGEGEILSVFIASQDVNIEQIPKEIQLTNSFTAIIGGSIYPPVLETSGVSRDPGADIDDNNPGGSDPGGSDPGGDDPGGSDSGGSDPGGSDPGGGDPGGGNTDVAVTGVSIDHLRLILKKGDIHPLVAEVFPSNATNKNITWSTNNPTVATVVYGNVTAISSGIATIMVTTEDGNYTAMCDIEVYAGSAEIKIPLSHVPIIADYAFSLDIDNAIDEQEVKLNGNKKVTVVAKDGIQDTVIFESNVTFTNGQTTVADIYSPSAGMYTFVITIEDIAQPILLTDVEVTTIMEALQGANSIDEITRFLTILGNLHPDQFNMSTVFNENMQGYLDEILISKPQTPSEVQAGINDVNDRTIVPQFVAGYPAIDELHDIWFDFQLRVNKNGTIYYMLVPDGATPPTPAEVKAGIVYGDVIPITSGSKTLSVGSIAWGKASEVAADTMYQLYLVTESESGVLRSKVVRMDIRTQPFQPAIFMEGYPVIDEIKDVEIALKYRISKSGNVYFIFVPQNSLAPTAEQVKAGLDYNEVSIQKYFHRSLDIDVIAYSMFSDLVPGMGYDIYAVVEDPTTGTLQPPKKLQVTTLSEDPPGMNNGYPRTNIWYDAFGFTAMYNKPSNVYYMLVYKGSDPPTALEVKAGVNYRGITPVDSGFITTDPLAPGANLAQFWIENLTSSTKYELYIVAEAMSGVYNELPHMVEIETSEAPYAQFASGHPSTDSLSGNSFYLNLHLTKPGKVYYLVVAKDSLEPTAEEVQLGNDYGGVTLVTKGALDANPYASVYIKDLYPGTEYDIYAVIEDATYGLLPAVAKLQVKMLEDSPPVYRKAEVYDVSDSDAKLLMGIDKAGYVYYLLQKAGEGPKPTAAQIKANPTGTFDLDEVKNVWKSLQNLMPETTYEIFVVAETTYGTLQAEPIEITFTTTEQVEPPQFNDGLTYIRYVDRDEVEFFYKLNKPGTLYYIFVNSDATEPTAEQIIAGIDYDDVSVIRSGQKPFIVDNSVPTILTNGLSPNTSYAIYLVAKGMGGKLTVVKRLNATTLP